MTRLPQPTASELKILHILWQDGPSTVRDVHARIARNEGLSYTTVLKQLQIMTTKGLVERDTQARAHIYKAVDSELQTQRELLGDFISRVYDGSSSRLVMQALGMSRPASAEELNEIDSLVRKLRQQSNLDNPGEENA